MRRYWLLVVALLLLWIDVGFVTDIKYPEYIFDEDYGRVTQSFVMNEVVGDHMRIDLVTDIPGLLILAWLVVTGGPGVRPLVIEEQDGKRISRHIGKMTKLSKTHLRDSILGFLLSIASAGCIVAMRILPLYTNGVRCYGAEYIIHLVDIMLPLLAVYYVMVEWIDRTDLRTTHRETDVAALLMMVSLFAGFFSRFARLYGFHGVDRFSWYIEGFLMLIALYSMWVSLKENARKLQLGEIESLYEKRKKKVDDSNYVDYYM